MTCYTWQASKIDKKEMLPLEGTQGQPGTPHNLVGFYLVVFCGEVLRKGVEKCWRRGLQRSAAQKCWTRLL